MLGRRRRCFPMDFAIPRRRSIRRNRPAKPLRSADTRPLSQKPLHDMEKDRRRQKSRTSSRPTSPRTPPLPQRPPHLRPGPRRHDQRQHPQDECKRRHHDWTQPHRTRLNRRLLQPEAILLHPLLRELDHQNRGFLHARPTRTTKPICTKIFMSMCMIAIPIKAHSTQHRHDQDDRPQQRPALVLRGKNQVDQHDRPDQRRDRVPCNTSRKLVSLADCC